MRRPVCALPVVLALLATPAVAEPAYRLVAGADADELQRELKAAGASGYGFLAAGEGLDVSGRSRIVALLERHDEGPRDYSVLHCSGNLSEPSIRGAVEARAAEGYRLPVDGILVRRRPAFWLPDSEYEDQTVLIFERSDSAARYEYEAIGFRSFDTLHQSLAERRAEGYEILGMWNTTRKLQVVLERVAGAESRQDRVVSPDEYRLLLLATRRVLKSKLNGAALEGYRLVDAEDPPTTGPPILLLRKAAAPGHRIEYRFAENVPGRMSRDQLEKRLNKRSRKGWRLPDGGITDSMLTLERAADRWTVEPRPRYRLVSSGKVEELPVALERSVSEGYRFVRLFVEPSRTTVLLVNDAADPARDPDLNRAELTPAP